MTIVEYILLAACYFLDVNFSFSAFQTVKLLMSFFFFALEQHFYGSESEYKEVKVLTYLMTNFRNPCHALISVGEDVFRYSQPGVTTSAERSCDLQPGEHSSSTSDMRSRMFFVPCVGFSLSSPEKTVEERLVSCEKCQDWAAMAIYVLSCHKYLSYSCVFPLRSMTWWFVGPAVGVDILLLWLRNKLLVINPISDIEHLLEAQCVLVTSIHIVLVAFDVLNLREERLEENDMHVFQKFPHRAQFLFEFLKLFVLGVLAAFWIFLVPAIFTGQYDFFLYVVVAFLVGICVHYWTSLRMRAKLA